MKGLRSISRKEFIEAAQLFAQKNKEEELESFHADKYLRDKYPAYDEIFQMVLTAAKTVPNETALLHSMGMLSTIKILIQLAEDI